MAGRALLASALCFVLVLQSAANVHASAAAGEWTGTIEGDFTGWEDDFFAHFKRHAEFTFTIEQDGTISGSGTGWEQSASQYCGGEADDISFKISGYVDEGTKAVLNFEEVKPNVYQTNCDFPMHPFASWQSFFEIELKDGASIDSGAGTRTGVGYPAPSGTDVLVIHGSDVFDFEISVEPQVVNVVQGETPSWELIVTLISGVPKPVTVQFFWINAGGTKDPANSYDITPTSTLQIRTDSAIFCDLSPGSYIGRYEATNAQGEVKIAQFTLNVIESVNCKALQDSDGDGIADSTDQCPEQSETVNGYLDADGCPDSPNTDTDGDGIPDAEDQCQINAETVDGTDDADGCPEITNVSIQGPALTGDGMLTLNTDDPDGWHTRWETGDGTIQYDTCSIGGGNGWCVSQQLYPNSIFQAKQCTPGSNGAYGYCTVAGNERTTSTDVWLVTGQMHVASNVKPIQPITSTGGYSDTGIVISYGEYTAALKGTEVIAEVKDDGTAILTVLEGQVHVWQTDKPSETVMIAAGQQLSTKPDEFLPGPRSVDPDFIKSIETLKVRDPTSVFPDEGLTMTIYIVAAIVTLGIIAAIVIGIYFGVKKIRNRKKQKLA